MKKHVLLLAFIFFSAVGYSQTVYSSEKGDKYHTGDCRLSGDAEPLALSEAKKKKKSACAVCKPNEWLTQKLVQCEGKTKDAKRCRRMTANKNKRCFQHGTGA